MDNFRAMNVKQLQSKCKEIGVPCTGKKKQLIERLEGITEMQNSKTMSERIKELEKTIAEMRLVSKRFQMSAASSPLREFASPEGSPVRNNNEGVSYGNSHPVATLGNTYIAGRNSSSVANGCLSGRNTNVTISYGNSHSVATLCNPPTGYPCAPHVIDEDMLHPFSRNLISTHVVQPSQFNVNRCQPPVCVSCTMPRMTNQQYSFPKTNEQVPQQATCFLADAHPSSLSSTCAPTNSDRPRQSSTFNIYEQQQRQQNLLHNNNNTYLYGDVREIIGILPEFNPSLEDSLNSFQFVKRINVLKTAYRWNDHNLIFAVQQKMQGPAKYWVDSLQIVFSTWSQFVDKFLEDFPCVENSADVHMKMCHSKRSPGETPQEYYFKMFALGTRGGLPEPAIARHIINGINEPYLKRKTSNEYDSCNKLLKDIINYCNYNDIVNANTTVQRHDKLTPQNKEKSANIKNVEKNNENFLSRTKCYNCSKLGHFSANCPEPSRKPRCKICQRTTHPTEKCPEKATSKTIINTINSKSNENDIIKAIIVNGHNTNTFVDPGSNRSLIRESYASIVGDIGKTKIMLEGFGGGEYECTGKVHTVLIIDDNSFEVDLLVVDDILLTENILLGRDVLCGEGKRLIIEGEACRLEHVDALSRAPDKPPTEIEPAGFIMKVTAEVDDWVVTMQLKDQKIINLMAVLKGEIRSDQEKQIKSEFCLKNHRLYRKDVDGLKLVIPKHIRWRIVKYSHDDMGHFGLEKTIQRIQQKFWFPKIRKYTKDYISSCIKCCYNKNRPGKSEARLHYSEVQPIPFHTVHVDHLGPFTKSKRGYAYVLAVSDSFSKYLIVKAVRNTKTTPVITALNEMTTYFGLPKCIVTDRGTAFTSKQFEDFCDENSIKHVKTAVRTPRANGQVERANQTILSYIKTTVEEPKNWDLTLRLRDITNNNLIAAIHDDIVENPLSIVEKRNLAVENINKERKKWEIRFNSKHATPYQYAENDMIVIENEPPATGESRKLEPKFRGPYIVSKVLGNDRYLIEDIPGVQLSNRRFSSVYSADKIKPWCSSCPALDVSSDEIEDDLVSE